MPSSKEDYRQLIDQPWGRMFYDMVLRQLDLSDDVPLRILDFGAGFCVTANHYAGHHKVTAVEPGKVLGIRTFFALSPNSNVKFTQAWYDKMLELEMKTCDVDKYKNVSFFHHLIFHKRG